MCMVTSLGVGKELIGFGDLDSMFKVIGGLRMLKNWFVCFLYPKRMDKFDQTRRFVSIEHWK